MARHRTHSIEFKRQVAQDYLALPGKPAKRCPECGQRVRAHSQSVNGNRAHFEHLKDDGTCPRAGKFHKKRRAG